ncbi:MAG: hypothetical protein MUO72_03710 [Bacteroidales bacterium]|nr:hypothetical protein [Bacteroidales bacterium]
MIRKDKLINFCVSIIIFILIVANSCNDKNKKPGCPPFEWIPGSPYDDPICHPSGKIIGFNHIPLKEIKYTYGFDCPRQALYIYDLEGVGFYLIDSDGQNQRRVLPYRLNCPSWSPDGKWIIFSNRNGDICKMPFDGDYFDTTSIIQLTTSGHNFFPKWSHDGNYIVYDNTTCGSGVNPIPPNSCGILIMDSDGNNKSFIIEARRFPYWGRSEDTIFYGLRYYDLVNKHENIIFDNIKSGFSVEGPPSFNPQKTKVFFLANYTYIPGPIKLCSVDPSGENFKPISIDPILKFTFMPDGRIIYLLYSYERIDEEKNALWIMDQDGSNKLQLTFNDFMITF